MNDEYTPTMDEVRTAYKAGGGYRWPERGEQFDRAIAAHDREVAALAWDKGYSEAVDFERGWLHAVKHGETVPSKPENPYRDPATQRPMSCATCGCDPRYPTAAHIVDCKIQEDQ